MAKKRQEEAPSRPRYFVATNSDDPEFEELEVFTTQEEAAQSALGQDWFDETDEEVVTIYELVAVAKAKRSGVTITQLKASPKKA